MEMKSETNKTLHPGEIRARWDEIKKNEPRLRNRDIAGRIGISEAELIASACDGAKVVRLQKKWEAIFHRLESLGPLMALTRNESAVHEKTGVYRNVSFEGHAGLVLDSRIDLRVFHKRWGFGFAFPVENPMGTMLSLQFFDKKGEAVHKIYLKDLARREEFDRLVEEFRHEDQTPGVVVQSGLTRKKTLPPEEVDRDAFLHEWAGLKDTHDFFPMLLKYKISRTGAVELARDEFAWPVSNEATRTVLHTASEREVPIMVFVGNPGMVQIHSGPVRRIVEKDAWLNVLDPDFNLHLRHDRIAESWVVEKPTGDGVVTSLEVFDSNGDLIATFFGERKPGRPEFPEWRQLALEIRSALAVNGHGAEGAGGNGYGSEAPAVTGDVVNVSASNGVNGQNGATNGI